MVKYIKPSKDESKVLCESENSSEYPPFEIERDDILKLYVVKGFISKNML